MVIDISSFIIWLCLTWWNNFVVLLLVLSVEFVISISLVIISVNIFEFFVIKCLLLYRIGWHFGKVGSVDFRGEQINWLIVAIHFGR